ncbi:MAG: FKBP-type peptidyl-prolyl cis-trans isomerase [Bacteroidales bacterium]
MMKTKIWVGLAALALLTTTTCGQMKNSPLNIGKVELTNATDTASYALGVNIASAIIEQGFEDLNLTILAKAFQDIYGKDKPLITNEESNGILQEYFMSLAGKAGEANLIEGQAFLEKNGKKNGVVTTASGLQYEVITQGTGPKPTAESVVKVHYHGTLMDGTVFDSSVDRGQPVEFPLNGVIRGWTEGVQLMPVGSKYKLYIPSDLGYGADVPPGGPIEPNTVLIFEVELIDIINN